MATADPLPGGDEGIRIVTERLGQRGIVITPKQAAELATAAVPLQQLKNLVRRNAAAPDVSAPDLAKLK